MRAVSIVGLLAIKLLLVTAKPRLTEMYVGLNPKWGLSLQRRAYNNANMLLHKKYGCPNKSGDELLVFEVSLCNCNQLTYQVNANTKTARDNTQYATAMRTVCTRLH